METKYLITILMVMVMLASLLLGATQCKKQTETDTAETGTNMTTIWTNPFSSTDPSETTHASTSGTTSGTPRVAV